MRSTTLLTDRANQSRKRSKPSLNFVRPVSIACATRGAARPTQVCSTVAWVRFRRVAAIAGLRVRATKIDSAIAETIVAENWR